MRGQARGLCGSPSAVGWSVSLLVHLGTLAGLYFVPRSPARPADVQQAEPCAVVSLRLVDPGRPKAVEPATEPPPAPSAQAAFSSVRPPEPKPPEMPRVARFPQPPPPEAPAPSNREPPPTNLAEALPCEPPQTPEFVAQARDIPAEEEPPLTSAPVEAAPEREGKTRQTSDQAMVLKWAPLAGNPPPRYPRLARRKGYEGAVLLTVRLSSQGRPVSVEVARSSGYRLLDEAAVEAVERWRFQPATDHVVPTEGETQVMVRFILVE